ncbi:hypothetical protein HDV05_001668 [Chytridiales sp. JEL 0842]|nr:hypothetical protein HDV05_001668 [Chytridiales sp. JEL 0842]
MSTTIPASDEKTSQMPETEQPPQEVVQFWESLDALQHTSLAALNSIVARIVVDLNSRPGTSNSRASQRPSSIVLDHPPAAGSSSAAPLVHIEGATTSDFGEIEQALALVSTRDSTSGSPQLLHTDGAQQPNYTTTSSGGIKRSPSGLRTIFHKTKGLADSSPGDHSSVGSPATPGSPAQVTKAENRLSVGAASNSPSTRRRSVLDFFYHQKQSSAAPSNEHSQMNMAATGDFDMVNRSVHSVVGDVDNSLHNDHTLAVALAALCNQLYRLLETESNAVHDLAHSLANPTAENINDLIQRAEEVHGHRPQNETTVTPEQRALWAEIDRLMTLVHAICIARGDLATPPPGYDESNRHASAIQTMELNSVLSAIDRVAHFAPRLFNQTVTLTDQQERVISAAALTSLIERLMAGRKEFENQRSAPANTTRLGTLNSLVDQITKASERTLSNQRVEMSSSMQNNLEMSKLVGAVEKQNTRRFKNQDWESREVRLLKDLTKLHSELMDASKKMETQRFVLSPAKERDMFMINVMGRLDRMEDRRFGNQDAVNPNIKRESDIADIVEKLQKNEGFVDQRA